MQAKYMVATVSAALLAAIECDALAGGLAGEGQIGLYVGNALSTKITGVHGDHLASSGLVDTKVGDVDVDPGVLMGIDARYYFNNYLGIDADALYLREKFPDQRVTLAGHWIDQPKADLDLYTLAIGPVLRYKGAGIWRTLNPYASVAFSMLVGSASDVNMLPVYGRGGTSSVDGKGITFRAGTQYNMERFGFTVEYRYDSMETDIDHFRSFWNGINLTERRSSVLLGGCLFF